MNTPNPLIPQGSLPATRGKNQIRIAVITILAIHVVLLLALLMAGCKKTSEQAKNDAAFDTGAPPPPPFDPNALPVTTSPPPAAAYQQTSTPPPAVTSTPTVTSLPPPLTATPPVTTLPPPAAAVEGAEHTIIKGDSFFTIAKKYNVTPTAIANANPGVESTRLKIGQKIKIPAPSTSATASSNGGLSAPGGGNHVYVVKSGETLLKIAKANGVSVASLRTANNLKTDRIKVGQKLRIPMKGSTPGTLEPAPAAGATGTTPQ